MELFRKYIQSIHRKLKKIFNLIFFFIHHKTTIGSQLFFLFIYKFNIVLLLQYLANLLQPKMLGK